jgi:predicted phosphodiesterase
VTIIIFSDTHLSAKFDPRLFAYLEKIIAPADRVIINGDFWDAYMGSFDRFVKSEWQRLFVLLKSKKTVYLYGNHDKAEWNDDRVDLFSHSQSDFHEFVHGDHKFHIQHGHRISSGLNDRWPIIPRWYPLGVLPRIWHEIGYRAIGDRFFNRYDYVNNAYLDWIVEYPHADKFIMSHSHRSSSQPDRGFYNTGFIMFGYASYIKIDEEGTQLIRESY